jgi:hypothetical protein
VPRARIAGVDFPLHSTKIMHMEDKPVEPATTASHTERIGVAYVAGITAARQAASSPASRNPYYHNTEEWVAYQSGWRDEMARRRRDGRREGTVSTAQQDTTGVTKGN